MEFGSEFVYVGRRGENNLSDDESEALSDSIAGHSTNSYNSGVVREALMVGPPQQVALYCNQRASLTSTPDRQGLDLPDPVMACSSSTVSDGVRPCSSQKSKSKKSLNLSLSRESPTPGSSSVFGSAQAHRTSAVPNSVETNVMAVKFDVLQKPSHMHTGEAIQCANPSCRGVLSNVSKLQPLVNEETSKRWECEFCGTPQTIECAEGEQPSAEDVTYLLEPANITATNGAESQVVFCLDISGSMCVSSPAPGNLVLRGRSVRDQLSELDLPADVLADMQQDLMQNQRRAITYVSRLATAQAAIDTQLEDIARNQPTRRAALVAFNQEVRIFGDGQSEPRVLSGRLLEDRDRLASAAEEEKPLRSLKDARTKLSQRMFDLVEGGETALGPALYISICLAARVPGSRVVLCTDGLANVGLGRLDDANDALQVQAGSVFYTELANLAKEKSVTIDIVSFTGTDCRLIELGQVSAATGGHVDIVDPLKLGEHFKNVLQDRLVATQVEATLLAHHSIYWVPDFEIASAASPKATFNSSVRPSSPGPTLCSIDNSRLEAKVVRQATLPLPGMQAGTGSSSSSAQSNPTATTPAAVAAPLPVNEPGKQHRMAKTIGNVTGKTTVTFRFGVRTNIPKNETTRLPFQVQIKYRDMEGNVALRVITKTRQQTRDENLAQRELNPGVLGTFAIQSSALMMNAGHLHAANLQLANYESSIANAPRAMMFESMTQRRMADSVSGELRALRQQGESLEARVRTKSSAVSVVSAPPLPRARAPIKSTGPLNFISGLLGARSAGSSNSQPRANHEVAEMARRAVPTAMSGGHDLLTIPSLLDESGQFLALDETDKHQGTLLSLSSKSKESVQVFSDSTDSLPRSQRVLETDGRAKPLMGIKRESLPPGMAASSSISRSAKEVLLVPPTAKESDEDLLETGAGADAGSVAEPEQEIDPELARREITDEEAREIFNAQKKSFM